MSGAAIERLLGLVRAGKLYPATILHGGSAAARQAAAVELARTLLCERPAPAERPCGACRHCRRIAWPGGDADAFHPDFAVLGRDLKTVTSAEATREFLRPAQASPFEARGQVFVVAEADTLSPEAGDALLKLLEEPGLGAPRHFLLLAPSRLDLTATLRSRSLAHYLGAAEPPDPERLEAISKGFAASLARWRETGAGVYLLDAAQRLAAAGDPPAKARPATSEFDDPRAARPWVTAAAAVRRAAVDGDLPREVAAPAFALAEALLLAPPLRLRGVSPERILEGLVSRHFAARR